MDYQDLWPDSVMKISEEQLDGQECNLGKIMVLFNIAYLYSKYFWQEYSQHVY